MDASIFVLALLILSTILNYASIYLTNLDLRDRYQETSTQHAKTLELAQQA